MLTAAVLSIQLFLGFGFDAIESSKYDNESDTWRHHGLVMVKQDVMEVGVCSFDHGSSLHDALNPGPRDFNLIGCGVFYEKDVFRAEIKMAYDIYLSQRKYGDNISDDYRPHMTIDLSYEIETVGHWYVPNTIKLYGGQPIKKGENIGFAIVSLGWTFNLP